MKSKGGSRAGSSGKTLQVTQQLAGSVWYSLLLPAPSAVTHTREVSDFQVSSVLLEC